MLHVLRQNIIQKEIDQADIGYNEPLEDEEEEEEAYECDDEDDNSLRTDLDTSRGRYRRGKGIMYEGGRSGITGRKRRGTTDIRVRRGMRLPSGRVPTGRSSVGSIKSFFPSYTSPGGQPQIHAAMTSKDMVYHAQKQVGKWFYDACIQFNAANSFQFQAMADAIASIGPGFKMPSYHQLRVVDIVFNNEFWESCVKLLKVCVPLVKVLRLADSEDRPSIGYLYEAMDKAKEAIRDNLKGKKKSYMSIWKIIDKRWTGQLHQPLHAAAYYLNPTIRFSPTFKKDREVMHGLLDCINILENKMLCTMSWIYMIVVFRTWDNLPPFELGQPCIQEEPATIFDDEDHECFNLEAEATEGFVDEGESATAGAEYVGEDSPILDVETQTTRRKQRANTRIYVENLGKR
ncbi:hypothetical protein EJ110_NYTH55907 [Nymphaea thermarum]|nr:hypothetical protein EJ110_NYTH55907 [Nymphaea thermarum]